MQRICFSLSLCLPFSSIFPYLNLWLLSECGFAIEETMKYTIRFFFFGCHGDFQTPMQVPKGKKARQLLFHDCYSSTVRKRKGSFHWSAGLVPVIFWKKALNHFPTFPEVSLIHLPLCTHLFEHTSLNTLFEHISENVTWEFIKSGNSWTHLFREKGEREVASILLFFPFRSAAISAICSQLSKVFTGGIE